MIEASPERIERLEGELTTIREELELALATVDHLSGLLNMERTRRITADNKPRRRVETKAAGDDKAA